MEKLLRWLFGSKKKEVRKPLVEFYRNGPYFVVRCRPWFIVGKDDLESADPFYVDEFATLTAARKECDRLSRLDREGTT